MITRRTAVVCAAGLVLASMAAAQSNVSGEWEVESVQGASLPEDFVQHVRQSGAETVFKATWKGAQNGPFGLTLIGLITPELRITTDGAENTNAMGPFTHRSHSGWQNERLVTEWATNEFQGSSFRDRKSVV